MAIKKPRGRPLGFGNGYTAAIPRQRVTPTQAAEFARLGGGEWLRVTLDQSHAQTVPTKRGK